MTEVDLYKHTLRQSSLSPLLIYTIQTKLTPCSDTRYDFFLLGSYPVRTVEILGIVVGVQAYEGKVLYLVDDGSAVIECEHSIPRVRQKDKDNAQGVATGFATLMELPTPRATLGQSVKLMGRLKVRKDNKIKIGVDTIGVCSIDDELNHWSHVKQMHVTAYDLPGPFILPNPNPIPPATPTQTPLRSVSSPITLAPSVPVPMPVPATPLRSSIPPEATPTPTRLRHPSRVRTHDLTPNTFRIYVKHYMDNADAPQRIVDPNRTPRSTGSKRVEGDSEATQYGFTRSYLRRIPDLSSLATRVVRAEMKRRQRNSKTTSSSSSSSHNKPIRLLKKQLFTNAIRQLHEESSIVLFSGPGRPLDAGGDTSKLLWKSVLSDTTNTANHTSAMSSITATSTIQEEEDLLTDPEDGEEVYIPLSVSFLTPHIINAIQSLQSKPTSKSFPRGPKALAIRDFLRRTDGITWQNLGQWILDDTLKEMARDGVIWNVNGDWEICG